MPTLTDTELRQIDTIEKSKHAAGLTIHEADTTYGHVYFTIESTDGGDVWSTDVLTVNRGEHVLMGHYRFGHEYDTERGAWAANPEKPIAHVSGYPGLRRRSAQFNSDSHAPTENAARKISRALGQAIAPFFADPSEAIANDREMAAQDWERKARGAESTAERELERAMNYRAEAHKIRGGGPYDRRGA